jgi:hypothetical protein
MPEVGFVPPIPVFERAKTIHALERAATVSGVLYDYKHTYNPNILAFHVRKPKLRFNGII